MLGEVLLRIKARSRPRGTKPSVPLLVDGDDVLCSSSAIARHAERVGRGEPLFPSDLDAEVERWVAISDRILGAGRARVLAGLRSNRAAQREALPAIIPGAFRAALSPIALTAAIYLGSKYDVPRDHVAEAERTIRPALDDVRVALGGRPYLLERFTFADIAIAASLQTLVPRARAALGPATRAVWSNEALAREYPDLLEWRDAVYANNHTGG